MISAHGLKHMGQMCSGRVQIHIYEKYKTAAAAGACKDCTLSYK